MIDIFTAGLKTRVAQSILPSYPSHFTSRILSPFFPHFLPGFFPAFFRQYLREAVCSGPLCSTLFVKVRGKAFTRNSDKKPLQVFLDKISVEFVKCTHINIKHTEKIFNLRKTGGGGNIIFLHDIENTFFIYFYF